MENTASWGIANEKTPPSPGLQVINTLCKIFIMSIWFNKHSLFIGPPSECLGNTTINFADLIGFDWRSLKGKLVLVLAETGRA